MTQRVLRYGLIGCGMMGHEHVKNIQLLENAEVAAIFEPNPEMRKSAQALVPNAIFPDNLKALIERDDLDCFVIVSPNNLHIEQLKLIAEKNPLPVLVEKPLAIDPADKAFLANLKEQYPAPIWVAMEYRYMPPVAALIADVEKATGGIKLLSIREHRFPFLEKVGDWNRFNASSGGTLVEKCCHFFDLMRHIIKSDPIRVMASAGQAVNHLDEVYDGKRSDIWDNGYVIVDFENGARAMLELCMFADGSTYQEEISAVGPDGKIECLVPGPTRFWPEHLGEAPTPKLIKSPRTPRGPEVIDIPVDPMLLDVGDHNGSTFYQHQKFQQVVLGNGDPEVTLSDGWWAVSMGMAAQQSAVTGQAVDL